MDLKKGWVVYNEKGYDELTTTSNNFFIEIKNGKLMQKKIISPKSLGFKIRNENELKGGSPKENAFLMRRLLMEKLVQLEIMWFLTPLPH